MDKSQEYVIRVLSQKPYEEVREALDFAMADARRIGMNHIETDIMAHATCEAFGWTLDEVTEVGRVNVEQTVGVIINCSWRNGV